MKRSQALAVSMEMLPLKEAACIQPFLTKGKQPGGQTAIKSQSPCLVSDRHSSEITFIKDATQDRKGNYKKYLFAWFYRRTKQLTHS